jgi:hypothetical protein
VAPCIKLKLKDAGEALKTPQDALVVKEKRFTSDETSWNNGMEEVEEAVPTAAKLPLTETFPEDTPVFETYTPISNSSTVFGSEANTSHTATAVPPVPVNCTN